MLAYDDLAFEDQHAGGWAGTGDEQGGMGGGSFDAAGPETGGIGGNAGAAGMAGAGSGGASGADSGAAPEAGSGGTGGSPEAGGAGGDSGAGGQAGSAGAGGSPLYPPELDLNNVVWLHTNVSNWPVTVNLTSVEFPGSQICMNHDIASKNWPIGSTGSTDVVGNPWVFIYHNDQWYGATWEWLRPPGQTCKAQSSVAGDHIKQPPFDASSGWTPSSGETLYFMVSGIARYGTPNAQERSEPLRVVWP